MTRRSSSTPACSTGSCRRCHCTARPRCTARRRSGGRGIRWCRCRPGRGGSTAAGRAVVVGVAHALAGDRTAQRRAALADPTLRIDAARGAHRLGARRDAAKRVAGVGRARPCARLHALPSVRRRLQVLLPHLQGPLVAEQASAALVVGLAVAAASSAPWPRRRARPWSSRSRSRTHRCRSARLKLPAPSGLRLFAGALPHADEVLGPAVERRGVDAQLAQVEGEVVDVVDAREPLACRSRCGRRSAPHCPGRPAAWCARPGRRRSCRSRRPSLSSPPQWRKRRGQESSPLAKRGPSDSIMPFMSVPNATGT